MLLLRKSLLLVLMCWLPGSWAQQHAAQVYGFTKPLDIYPSKTHYLMVVDHHIQRFFNRYGVPYLLRLDVIPTSDRHALLSGVRKAILFQASVSWDIGLVQHYGRDIDGMLGFKPASEDYQDIARVRQRLFSYIQASEMSRKVVLRHQAELVQLWGDEWRVSSGQESSNNTCQTGRRGQADFVFYSHLKQLEQDKSRATSFAYRYELLSMCDRVQVQNALEHGVNTEQLWQLLVPNTANHNTVLLVSRED